MKSALYGRIVFGASAICFGAIALLWRDAATWQTLSQIWRLPLGAAAGASLMILQIAGGLGILYPRAARPASLLLAAVYFLFSLACIPGILAAPTAYEHYPGFFEQFCVLSGALALCAATGAGAAPAAAFGRAARLGLGICALSFMLTQIVYFRATANLVPAWMPPGQTFWAIFTTVAFALAAIAILLNRRARLAIRLMTVMLALFGLLVWIPLLAAHPEAHLNWSEFALTLLITAAAWVVADLKSF